MNSCAAVKSSCDFVKVGSCIESDDGGLRSCSDNTRSSSSFVIILRKFLLARARHAMSKPHTNNSQLLHMTSHRLTIRLRGNSSSSDLLPILLMFRRTGINSSRSSSDLSVLVLMFRRTPPAPANKDFFTDERGDVGIGRTF
mmetsp:Transcript_12638/g.33606  ORF Transcript_12638/g.33606 Transcript_12638/m.33606 type:complete len:142 (-) Transcript_12638:100-525(-)